MSTPEKVERKGFSAHIAAVARLKEEFAERWEEVLAEERKARGLLPRVKRQTLAQAQEELAAARARIAELEGAAPPAESSHIQ